jgi:hypothetical protein
MITPDYHTPMKTKLLWVYEGLDTYLGEVLMVRAGLATPEEYRVSLARTIRGLNATTGRQWRPLEDTAVASHLSRAPGRSWNQLRRTQDYYPEGMMIWYEADAIIREKTDGAKSLDDFCKKFFAEGSAMLPLMLALYTSRLGQAAAPLLPRIESELANHFDYMEGALADRQFFAGNEFRAADVQMSFVLEAADGSGRLEAYPRLKELISRYRERAAYKRAIEKGGPLELTRR